MRFWISDSQNAGSTKHEVADCPPVVVHCLPITRSRSVDVKPAIRRLKRPSGEREVTHQLTAGRRYYAGTALEASDFPEPIAESHAAPLTSERKLKSSMNQNMTTGMKAVTFSVAHSTQREICRQIQRYRQVLVL